MDAIRHLADAGACCFAIGPHVVRGGAEMTFAGFVALLPGSLAAVAIVEKVLWHPLALGMAGMTVAEAILALGVNLMLWLAVQQAARHFLGDPDRE